MIVFSKCELLGANDLRRNGRKCLSGAYQDGGRYEERNKSNHGWETTAGDLLYAGNEDDADETEKEKYGEHNTDDGMGRTQRKSEIFVLKLQVEPNLIQ